jgi:hypothetical protein
MRRPLLLTLALALVGCGKEPTVVPVRNLERPADMGFVCMRQVKTAEGLRLTGRPMTDCHPHLDGTITPQPPNETINLGITPRQFGTFGLVTQTARGEVGVVDMDAGRLVDLDPTQPGYNMLPVGKFPEVMAASQDGCLVATANRGSCDLAIVDPQLLLAQAFGPGTVAATDMGGHKPIVTRVVPTTASGTKLQVAPQEIAFLPQPPSSLDAYLPPDQAALPDPQAMCHLTGAFDRARPGQRAPWRAVVTFPSCDLVAIIELPSGNIVSSVYVRSTGVVDAGNEPVCPTDCGAGVAPQPGPDAAPPPAAADASPDLLVSLAPDAPPAPIADAAPVVADGATGVPAAVDAAPLDASLAAAPADAGAPDRSVSDVAGPRIPGGTARTGALAIRPEGQRLYVGGSNDVYITALDIVGGKLQAAPGGGRIPLHDGAGGVRRLRLSLDPFYVAPSTAQVSAAEVAARQVGRFMGANQEKQYLYAFAGDDSVRVVNVNPLARYFERECDLNVDPQGIPSTDPQFANVRDCYALLDDPVFPPARRRAFARGPGLRVPNLGNAGQAPPIPQDIAFSSQREKQSDMAAVAGDFGFLVTSDVSSLSGVYVLNVDSLLSAEIPDNSYRDYNAGPLGTPGGPMVTVQPARNFALSDVPLPARVPLDTTFQGPRIEGMFLKSAPTQVTWVTFPDPHAAHTQSWQMAWEGALTSSTRTRGSVLAPTVLAETGTKTAGSVLDQGQEFCQQGVLSKDIVLLTGCVQNTDCATDGTLVCRQAVPGTPGLCFPATLTKDADLLTACTRVLTSRRRYDVVKSTPQRLDLALRPDEIPRSAFNPCETDADCRSPRFTAIFDGYSCLQVRKDEPKRCVKTCTGTDGAKDDKLCRAGTVCEQIDGALAGPLCVEGPPIQPGCWPAGAGYEVQAGQSFLVTGTLAARPPTVRAVEGLDHQLSCVRDDTRNPLLVDRIPLDAPHCANVPDLYVVGADGVATTNPENSHNALAATFPSGPPGTWGNPCLFWGINDDDVCAVNTVTGVRPAGCNCDIDKNTGRRPDNCHVKALFQNPELRFVVTNLEQFAGDANISRFDVTGGFRPEVVSTRDDILVTMGVRAVTGPLYTPESGAAGKPVSARVHYLYLLDQGRTGSSTAGRGQVLRINPRYGVYGLPQFDSNYSPYPFQIQ